MKIAICDDNEVFVDMLREKVSAFMQERAVECAVESLYSAEELLKGLSGGAVYDLIFLDIKFPESNQNGVDIGKYLRDELHDEKTFLVYISSVENYAIQLFDSRPLNFLVKPIDNGKLDDILDYVLRARQYELVYYDFSVNKSKHSVLIAEIIYFESDGHSVTIHCRDGIKYQFSGKISHIAKELEEYRFFSPHKSYLVNYYAVKHWMRSELTLIDDTRVPISRSNQKMVMKLQMKEDD